MANKGALLIISKKRPDLPWVTHSEVLGMYICGIKIVENKQIRVSALQCVYFMCVFVTVMHMMAPLSNLKPGLKAHLSLVVDR